MARGKGSGFERDMARRLSLWWSGGEHDDLFWRVMGSGGRATRRSRTGKGTLHQSFGDIEATDPSAKALTNLMVIELKRGYGRWALEDVLDNKVASTQTWCRFVKQTVEGWRASKRRWWVVIYKRDQRVPMIAMCPDLFVWLTKQPPSSPVHIGRVVSDLLRVPKIFLKQAGDASCALMRLEDFLDVVPPVVFKEVVK